MEDPDLYVLGPWDSVLVGSVLTLSSALGLVYVWRARKARDTREFLVANRSLGVAPLVMSAVATYLTPTTVLGGPMEGYANGVQMVTVLLAMFPAYALAAYATVPVFFGLRVCTINQNLLQNLENSDKMAAEESPYLERLGPLDYAVVISVVCLSGAIGLYHVWQSRKSKNTREFLVANRNLGIFPLVLSTVATFLAPNTMLGQPMEAYSNGVQITLSCFSLVLTHVFSMYATIPVFFRLNLCTVNQYLEYRFNRFLRIFPAAFGLLQNSVMIASFTYVTALVLSQATGVHFWTAMAIICGVCIVYSSLGGVTAVIWTDVLQVVVIFTSLTVLAVKGTVDVGSVREIWEINRVGKRTTFFHVQPNEESNYTMWSLLFGNYFLIFGGAILSQTALQRQMANRSLTRARLTVFWTVVFMTIASLLVSWIGMVIYSKYANCDPLLNGQLESRDQLAALFAMEIFKNTDGLFGLFVAGILATTLSTLSSVLNSVSTVALIDFIRPLAPNMSDSTSTLISKILGVLYGSLVVALTGVVEHLGNIIQVAGTSLGPTAGIFVLGFFLPWTTSTGATVGYFTGLAFGWWVSIGRLWSQTPYVTAPMSTTACNVSATFTSALNLTAIETPIDMMSPILPLSPLNVSMGISPSGKEIFPLYSIVPLWYTGMTMTIVVIVGLSVSLVLGPQDPETLDPRVVSPLVFKILGILPEKVRKCLGYKKWTPDGQKKVHTSDVSKEEPDVLELKITKQEGNRDAKPKIMS